MYIDKMNPMRLATIFIIFCLSGCATDRFSQYNNQANFRYKAMAVALYNSSFQR